MTDYVCWLREMNGYTEGKTSSNKTKKTEIFINSLFFSISLRIDDWIPRDFGTANPFQVVKYFKMGIKSRKMRVNDLR